jgi:hypothetical protein
VFKAKIKATRIPRSSFEIVLLKDNTINCRVKRHLISTSTQKHGSPAETKPDAAIPTHHPNTTEAKPNEGPKLDSKVLAIEPNRLLKI